MKPKLSWAIKYSNGDYQADTEWTKKVAKNRIDWPEHQKVVRVEIKEVKKK